MRLRTAATVVAAAATLLLPVHGFTPAAAHPSGHTPVAEVTADGSQVTVRWSAPDEDLFALGQVSGAMRGPQVFVYEDGAPAEGHHGHSLAPWAGVPAVADYLTSHISVRQAGHACPLRSADTDAIETKGAMLRFACADDVADVQVEITALTDLDPSYRTASTAPGGDRALHTSDHPTRTLRLGRPADPAAGTAAHAAVLAVVAAAQLWL